MRCLPLLLIVFSSFTSFGQQVDFTPVRLSLPPEVAYYDNQVSGLCIHNDKLFFMSESRLQDKAEAKLYSIALTDLDRKISDTSLVLPYKKWRIYNLDLLRNQMEKNGDSYEGLEAMLIDENENIYFSVETATPSANCYVIKGHLNYSNVVMDPETMVMLKKPVNRNRTHIYNAGFEAMAFSGGNVLPFFEYNFFPDENYVKMLSGASFEKNSPPSPLFTDRIPFRLTDITATAPEHYTGINYFYKGGGDDAVYRVPKKDASSYRLTIDSSGNFHSYCRLIDIAFTGTTFTWKTLWEMPEAYWGFNWEGIAAYKQGYFLVNDKYTPAKPYATTLLYLQKK